MKLFRFLIEIKKAIKWKISPEDVLCFTLIIKYNYLILWNKKNISELRSVYFSNRLPFFLSLEGDWRRIVFLQKADGKVREKGKGKMVLNHIDELEFTYLEAEKKFKMTGLRFTRAIDDLIEKGFIEIVHQGGSYFKKASRIEAFFLHICWIYKLIF